MLLHQLGEDFVLLLQLLLQSGDAAVPGVFASRRTARRRRPRSRRAASATRRRRWDSTPIRRTDRRRRPFRADAASGWRPSLGACSSCGVFMENPPSEFYAKPKPAIFHFRLRQDTSATPRIFRVAVGSCAPPPAPAMFFTLAAPNSASARSRPGTRRRTKRCQVGRPILGQVQGLQVGHIALAKRHVLAACHELHLTDFAFLAATFGRSMFDLTGWDCNGLNGRAVRGQDNRCEFRDS